MPNPQKENGYTPIANELMEALSRYRIPGEQMQCLLFIIRKTYGFNKKDDMISNSQFVTATGLKKGNVSRAIKSLVERRVVIKNDNTRVPTYRFNKNYPHWRVLSKKQPVIKAATPVIKSDNGVLSKVMDTKDTSTKDTSTKAKIVYPEWLDLGHWKDFKEYRKVKDRKALTVQAEKINIKKLKGIIDQGFSQKDIIEEAIGRNWASFFPPKNAEPGKGEKPEWRKRLEAEGYE